MNETSDSENLLKHIENFLGTLPTQKETRKKNGEALPFQVLIFNNCPQKDEHTLITFGLSTHVLKKIEKEQDEIRVEFLICAKSATDIDALKSLLFAVGLDALDGHKTPGLHGVLKGSGPVLFNGNPEFEHLYLTNPGYFPSGFDICKEVSAPIHIFQITPVSSGEVDIIKTNGWSFFEDLVIEKNIDFLDFDKRLSAI